MIQKIEVTWSIQQDKDGAWALFMKLAGGEAIPVTAWYPFKEGLIESIKQRFMFDSAVQDEP